MHIMSSTPHRSSTAPTEWRTTFDLALLVSTVAVALAIGLSTAGVGEAPIVLLTLTVASVVGWRQPSARISLAPVMQLESTGSGPD